MNFAFRIWKLYPRKFRLILNLLQRFLSKSIHKIYFIFDTKMYSMPMFNKGKNPRVFNLDLHTSVIRDIEFGLKSLDIDVKRWSISKHNKYIRKNLRGSDPVKYVNANTWQDLNDKSIIQFHKKYYKFLKQFDGFIVTYPPTFIDLFLPFNKPILLDIAIRYEIPYTNNDYSWKSFNERLKNGYNKGGITLWSNNKADCDYLEYFTGLQSKIVPSVCDYLGDQWKAIKPFQYVSIIRDNNLKLKVATVTKNAWTPIESLKRGHYEWEDILSSSVVFLIPYNISTMQLFELATAGVPVIVPSKNFLKKLWQEGYSVLTEISWYQVHNISTEQLADSNPNKWQSDTFIDWWLERADFYNADLMPNVITIEDFNDLNAIIAKPEFQLNEFHLKQRNGFYRELRLKNLLDFTKDL